MECPVCKTVNLVMSERKGIEIDYCPQCRGVWLDRGELDKIIDRSLEAMPRAEDRAAAQPEMRQPSHGHHDPYHGRHRKKKREGFLSDLFDFD